MEGPRKGEPNRHRQFAAKVQQTYVGIVYQLVPYCLDRCQLRFHERCGFRMSFADQELSGGA
jgi:hypothetical protein